MTGVTRKKLITTGKKLLQHTQTSLRMKAALKEIGRLEAHPNKLRMPNTSRIMPMNVQLSSTKNTPRNRQIVPRFLPGRQKNFYARVNRS